VGGNSLEEGLLIQNRNPRHTVSTFPAVMMVCVTWMTCFVVFNIVDYAPVPGWLVLFSSFFLGLLSGWLMWSFLKGLSYRRRAELAAQYRADQEAETQRKLEVARKAGII